jgi:hypothetical protein
MLYSQIIKCVFVIYFGAELINRITERSAERKINNSTEAGFIKNKKQPVDHAYDLYR